VLKDYKLLTVASILALVVMVLAVVKGSRSEFAEHQRDYYELCGGDDYEVEIKQINVNIGGRALIDRCTSCHIGFANPDAADFEQPLTAHHLIAPGAEKDPHDLSKIGCIACHDGNGRAVTEKDAHGHFHMWPNPLLTGAAVQASCIRCHDTNAKPLAGAPVLNQGRSLFMEKVCWSCHTIDGISNGKVGPDLSSVGDRFGMDYLRESIVHPTANIASSRMPEFDWVSDDSIVDALTVYLKSQHKKRYKNYEQAPVGVAKPEIAFTQARANSIADGRKIFMGEQGSDSPRRGGCINCHTIRESNGKQIGGHVGPELTYAGRARDASYIEEHIRNSKGHTPDSVMPAFTELTDTGVLDLIQYLKSLNYVDAKATSGEQTYATYCSSCHGDDLKGRGKNYHLLDPYPRNLSRKQFVKSYKVRFSKSIAEGVKGTAMPPWKTILAEEQIDAVIEFIAKKSGDSDSPEPFVRLSTPLPKTGEMDRLTERKLVAVDPERGQSAFEAHCTGCHGKLANGKGPNAYTLGNVYPRNFLNTTFMAQEAVDDERMYRSVLLGVPGTPMPSHSHLSDQTVLDLIAYLRTLTK
jgi:mono/diheme cytochrome c family protein